ncbi:kinase-like domain-containing protein [Rhizophagus clarus]|uniref:Kinase-like domain-containing protein n=1 Tax=Rhizophagus clarus TaxID=94130 RepID=A0A8H3MKP1_9GLOM|nr:kinase-like domain-containing protein [Rhizophagus clarus]
MVEWIPYDQFKDVKYFDNGGFGTIHKAIWLSRNIEVILKCPNNLNENLDEFLNELGCKNSLESFIYGFTKNPDTLNYMIVRNDKEEENEVEYKEVYISDLGLCQPAKSLKKHDIYGVIPFMAPEVLREHMILNSALDIKTDEN